MKKAGIVSLYYNNENLGGLLQAYAVVQILRQLGLDAEQLCYDTSILSERGKKIRQNRRKALARDVGPARTVKMGATLLHRKWSTVRSRSIKNQLREQSRVFDEFRESIPHSATVYNAETIQQANRAYATFICGSDQVWNPWLCAHEAYTLGFAETEKKCVALAVSMGKANLTEYEKQILTSQLWRFAEISVREKSFQKLLCGLTTAPVCTVLDPTLLLSAEQWLALANPAAMPKEKYVFCYFLGNAAWQRQAAQCFADVQGLKLIHIPYIQGTIRAADRPLQGEPRWNVGPREFIELISKAEYVFTDSFHAMVFSAIFQKKFYVFDRDGKSDGYSMSARISDFLSEYSLLPRYLHTQQDSPTPAPVDYTDAAARMKVRQEETLQFIRRNLGL